MADSKIDPLDVGALERSVNDSAGRVSGIWLSFVAFSAYLAAAASNVSHRQLFLEDPIKLPTINIDLPLVASAILLPVLFVIYHVYVLLQVVLLARTAAAYNEAIARAAPEAADSTLMRQRLANTLFAQLFAGSPREREGVLGWLLRAMAWITLAIAPVLVLFLFELRFLPYHSEFVTWTHRGLIALDLLAVLVLWTGAVTPARDITWRAALRGWRALAGALVIALLCVLVTFPGEPARNALRALSQPELTGHPECWSPLAMLYSDRLAVPGGDFVDDEKFTKIVANARSNGQQPHESDRTRSFRGRDLRCGQFAGADLRRSDFSGAELSGASFKGAHLDGTIFSGARLDQAVLDGAHMQGAYFSGEESAAKASEELLNPAELPRASLRGAQLQGASLRGVGLQGAILDGAQLHGADLDGADLQYASVQRARLHGATLKSARLHGVMLISTQAPGASFDAAQLQVAAIGSADLHAAEFYGAFLQGTRLDNSRLALANFSRASLWRSTGAHCGGAQVSDASFEPLLEFDEMSRPRGHGTISYAADQLRNRVKERLAPDAPNIQAERGESEWRTCAEKTLERDAYQEKRAEALAQLVCNSGANGAHIAAGLARNMGSLMGSKGVPVFVRGIIGPDGKPCAGARDLDDRVKAELLEAAKN